MLQDNDPHHLHPNPNELYWFLILAVILAVLVMYGGAKLMNYLDKREERKRSNNQDKEK